MFSYPVLSVLTSRIAAGYDGTPLTAYGKPVVIPNLPGSAANGRPVTVMRDGGGEAQLSGEGR